MQRHQQWLLGRKRILLVLLCLSLIALSAPGLLVAAMAQEAAPPDLAAELPPGVMMEILSGGLTETSRLPAPPATLLLERLIFAPGEGVPLGPAPGVEILVVEAGTLSITDELGIEGAYPAGSQLFVQPGLVFSYANLGSEPVSLLRVAIESAAAGGTPVAGSPIAGSPAAEATPGADPGVLVEAPISAWPEGIAYVFLSRVTWEPGAELPLHTFSGPTGFLSLDGVLTIAGPSGIEGQLPPNRSLGLPAGVESRQRNAGTDPAVTFIVGVVPAQTAWISDLAAPVAETTGTEIAMTAATPPAAMTEPGTVPMLHGNAARTGVMPGPGVEGAPILKWSEDADGGIEYSSSVVVREGIVYLRTAFGATAYDAATGEVVWVREVGRESSGVSPRDRVRSSPALANDLVIFGSADGVVYALDAATGDTRWEYETGGPVLSAPAVADGVVYVGSNDDSLYALDAVTGTELWLFAAGNDERQGPAVANGVVVFITTTNVVHGLNAADGQELWRFEATGGPDARYRASPVIVGSSVYVVAQGGALHALELTSGNELWRVAAPEGSFTLTPAVTDDTIYITARTVAASTVHALDTSTGQERWRISVDGLATGSPAIADGVLYLTLGNNWVFGLDLATGQERWRYQVPGQASTLTTPAIVGGVAYIGSSRGVKAIGGTEGASAVTPTPVPVAEGASVVVIGEGAVLRAAPSPIGVVVEELANGARLEIVGPAEERDGTTWWRAEAESGRVGFIAGDAIAAGD